MQHLIDLFMQHQAMIFAVLFTVSELLAFIPGVKANGIFQSVYNFIKKKHEELP